MRTFQASAAVVQHAPPTAVTAASAPATPTVAHAAAVRTGAADQVTPAGWEYKGYYYFYADCVSDGEYFIHNVWNPAVTYQCPPAYDWFWGWGYGLYVYYN